MEKHSDAEWRRWGLVRPLRTTCWVCVLLCKCVCVCVRREKNVDVAYRLWRLSTLRSGYVRTPHLPSQDAAECVFTRLCVRVLMWVCVVAIWAEHQGYAWTARWASPLLICPAPSPHQRRSPPRQGQYCHPCNTNSRGRRWLSIIDGSWL